MSTPDSTDAASLTQGNLSLEAVVKLMEPLVELLLRHGVTYPQLTNALKTSFLECGNQLMDEGAQKVTDASLSTMTGVHRKDIREWRNSGRPLPKARKLGPAMEAFTRWSTDARFCDAQGHPKPLLRGSNPDSFDALALSVSNDVHPPALLREMIRLGLVVQNEVTTDAPAATISLCRDAFVPRQGSAEMLQLMRDNVGDHLAAAVSNVVGKRPSMLEQSVYADGLTQESVDALNALARQLWKTILQQSVEAATSLYEQDRHKPDADRRIRIGMYFYQGPHEPAQSDSTDS